MAAGRIVPICVLVLLFGLAPDARPGIAARTRNSLEALESWARGKNPSDHTAWNRIADARLRLLVSTGNLSNLQRARDAVAESLKVASPASNHAGLALRVRMELASHRFREAKRSAEELCSLTSDSSDSLALLGDACFNLGEYAACEEAWTRMAGRGPNILLAEPRLAQLDLLYGRNAEARTRYQKILEAARKLEHETPDLLAWACVQLGELAFRTGDWETATQSYEAALAAQPQYYPALEHQAELRGAQGRVDEAVALYTHLIERSRRAEIMHALGDLYFFSGNKEAAASWHASALAAYLASVEKGEATYFHHLALLYSDNLNEPDRAVEWARRDLTMREGIQTCDTLAWALYKAGSVAEARDMILRVLSLNPGDPGILYHAGIILMRAGDLTAGRLKLQEALAVNPRYNTFHVHRG